MGEVFVNLEIMVDGVSQGVQAFLVGEKRKVVATTTINGAAVEIVADASTFGS